MRRCLGRGVAVWMSLVCCIANAQTPSAAQVTLESAQAAAASAKTTAAIAQSALTTAQTSGATLPQLTSAVQLTVASAQSTALSFKATQTALAVQGSSTSPFTVPMDKASLDAQDAFNKAQAALNNCQTATAVANTLPFVQAMLVAAQQLSDDLQLASAPAATPKSTATQSTGTAAPTASATDISLVPTIDSLFDLARKKTETTGIGPTFDVRLRTIDLMATIGTRSENTVARLGALLPLAGKKVEWLALEDSEKPEFAKHVIQALGKMGPDAKSLIPQIIASLSIDANLLPDG